MNKSNAAVLIGTLGVGGIILATVLSGNKVSASNFNVSVGILLADSNNQPVPVNAETNAFEINEGETYTASVVMQNNSTRGGQPYAINVLVNATAAGNTGGTYLSPTTKEASLYAGGSGIVTFPINPPLGSGPDTGTLIVNVKNTEGNTIAVRTVNFTVKAVLVNPAAEISINEFSVDEGKTTPVSFYVTNKSTRGNEYWPRIFNIAVVAAANNTGTLANKSYNGYSMGENAQMEFIFNLSPEWDTGEDRSGIVSIVVKDAETNLTVASASASFTINKVPIIYDVIIENIS